VGYSAQPSCPASFSFRVDGYYTIDEITFHCQVKEGHKIHIAECDFPKLGKRVSLSWGAGKPKVVETPLLPAMSPSPDE